MYMYELYIVLEEMAAVLLFVIFLKTLVQLNKYVMLRNCNRDILKYNHLSLNSELP